MVITAWILFVFFGFISLHGLLKFISSSVDVKVWFFAVIMFALAAGIIWSR